MFLRMVGQPLAIITPWHDYYQSKLSSTVAVKPLACAHSLLFNETRYDPSDSGAPRHRDNDPRHGAAVRLLLRCDRRQHLLCAANHWADRTGHRPDQHHGQPDRVADPDRLCPGPVLPRTPG
ncbi:hypothetical protein EMIT0P218_11052 [Pseudomonas sp. IT-P218]